MSKREKFNQRLNQYFQELPNFLNVKIQSAIYTEFLEKETELNKSLFRIEINKNSEWINASNTIEFDHLQQYLINQLDEYLKENHLNNLFFNYCLENTPSIKSINNILSVFNEYCESYTKEKPTNNTLLFDEILNLINTLNDSLKKRVINSLININENKPLQKYLQKYNNFGASFLLHDDWSKSKLILNDRLNKITFKENIVEKNDLDLKDDICQIGKDINSNMYINNNLGSLLTQEHEEILEELLLEGKFSKKIEFNGSQKQLAEYFKRLRYNNYIYKFSNIELAKWLFNHFLYFEKKTSMFKNLNVRYIESILKDKSKEPKNKILVSRENPTNP